MKQFGMAALIFTADFFSKKVISSSVKEGEKKEIVKNRFYLWHIKNKGAAYNSFEGYMTAIKCISVAGIVFCIIQLLQERKKSAKATNTIAYSFLLGGALGNLFERVKYGFVTDFLYIHHNKLKSFQTLREKSLPIFNIADIFVALGGGLLMILCFLKKEN